MIKTSKYKLAVTLHSLMHEEKNITIPCDLFLNLSYILTDETYNDEEFICTIKGLVFTRSDIDHITKELLTKY